MAARKTKQDRVADEILDDDNDSPGTDDGGDDDEGDDDPEPQGDPDVISVEPPKSRRQQRQNRFREDVVSEVESRVARVLEQRLASLPQLQPQRQEPRQDQPDQFSQQIDARLQAIYDQQDSVSATFRAKQKDGTLTDSEYGELTKKARKLDEERTELLSARAARKLGLGRQSNPQEAAQEAIRQQTRARHSDVYDHPEADHMVRYAEGYFQTALARAHRLGRQVNPTDLLDESLDKAREEWGMQTKHRRHERTESERRKFTGAPTSGGRGSETKTIKMTSAHKAMADAFAPHIKDDHKRYAHWAKTVGKGLVGGGD